MRTTITLEPDVAAQVRATMKRGRVSLKQVVNQALRAGLGLATAAPPAVPYRTRTVDLGASRIGSLDDVAAALATAEGESFR